MHQNAFDGLFPLAAPTEGGRDTLSGLRGWLRRKPCPQLPTVPLPLMTSASGLQ